MAGALSGNVECSLQAGEHGGRLQPSLNTLYAQQLGHLFDPAPCLTGVWPSAKNSNANNIGPTSAPPRPLGQRSATCLQLQDGNDAARVQQLGQCAHATVRHLQGLGGGVVEGQPGAQPVPLVPMKGLGRQPNSGRASVGCT